MEMSKALTLSKAQEFWSPGVHRRGKVISIQQRPSTDVLASILKVLGIGKGRGRKTPTGCKRGGLDLK